jgi:hypothetical protein
MERDGEGDGVVGGVVQPARWICVVQRGAVIRWGH